MSMGERKKCTSTMVLGPCTAGRTVAWSTNSPVSFVETAAGHHIKAKQTHKYRLTNQWLRGWGCVAGGQMRWVKGIKRYKLPVIKEISLRNVMYT